MIFGKTIGIEISGQDLHLAVLRARLGKRSLELTRDISGFLDMASEDRKSAILRLITELNLSASRVFLSLPCESGILRQIEFPVEVRDRLKSVVGLQIESLCPWTADEVYWDFSYEPPPKNAKTVRVNIAIIAKAALDPWIQFFNTANLPLSGATLSSLAHARGVRTFWPGDAPTLVLDCEKDHVEGTLIRGGQLCALRQAGADLQANARAAAERLLSLGRIGSIDGARLVVYGSAAGSIESVERVRLPLEKAKPESSDAFGAISTALNGSSKGELQSNLVPSALRYRHNQRQLIPTYVLLLLAAVLAMCIGGREPYQSMIYASKLEQEIHRIAPVAREVSKQQSDLNRLTERYRALSDNLQHRDYSLETLRELARVLPPKAWLGSYVYQDGAITVSGFADSASEVQKALADNPLFRDVQFTSSVTRDAKGKDHFTLKASIEAPK